MSQDTALVNRYPSFPGFEMTVYPTSDYIESGMYTTFQPTVYFTPLPTSTIIPTPTWMGIGIGQIKIYSGYSYYYPPLAGVNCLEWDEDSDTCVDQTASGEKWSDWVGKGVALHPTHLQSCPYGSIFRVHAPSVIQGDWVVVDMCPGCWNEYGGFLTDFLMDYQALDWWTVVEAECIRGEYYDTYR